MEALLSDIRYGLRALRRAPLFAASVALTIGIGLGILCSVFTIFNAYVLRPFPVDDPYSLYEFSRDTKTARRQAFTWREFIDLRDQADLFTDVFAVRTFKAMVHGRPFAVELVTSNYFSMLGVDPVVGRTLSPTTQSRRAHLRWRCSATPPGRTGSAAIPISWASRFE